MSTKKRKKKGPQQVAPAHTLCVGTDCDGAPLPTTIYASPSDFTHTTTSHHPKHSKEERIKRKCIYNEKKKDFTGQRCVTEKEGECLEQIYDTYCKPKDDPCVTTRKGCPVQFIFVEGKPTLRFCTEPKKPGHIVPVDSPEEAQRLAEEACKDWKRGKKWSPTFFKRKAPQVVKAAKKSHPKSPWGPGLGQPPAAPELPPGMPQVPAQASMSPMIPLVGAFGAAVLFALSKK